MAMTWGGCQILPACPNMTRQKVAQIVIKKLTKYPGAIVEKNGGVILPVDSVGYWLSVSPDGVLEIGEPGV